MSDNEAVEIYCPHCRYHPVAEDRWRCMPSCAALFHTFWTRGLCPACGWHWQKTQCPQCQVLSPHQQWYHPKLGQMQSQSKSQLIKKEAPSLV